MNRYMYYSDLNSEQKKSVDFIFFETSSIKEFESTKIRQQFHQKYLGFYQEYYPEHFICVLENENVLGYICGAIDSINDIRFFENLTYFHLFADLYKKYPAHLHINMGPSSSGKGLGSKLIRKYEQHLLDHDVNSVHLITSPKARNINFYKKNHYSFTCKRVCKGQTLLFMGKSLTH